jgi:hypothetical protein
MLIFGYITLNAAWPTTSMTVKLYGCITLPMDKLRAAQLLRGLFGGE